MISRPDWRTHRPLLFPALALWGWQSDLLWAGLGMGLVLEAPRLVRARLDISQTDFQRLWSFTAVLFLAVVLYLGIGRLGFDSLGEIVGSADAVERRPEGMRLISGTALTFLRWLPFIVFPFLAAVVWSRSTALPWSTFSMYEQARARRQPHLPPPEWATQLVHPGYVYLGTVIFAATTNPGDPRWFLPLMLLVALIALWPWRSRGHGALTWLLLFAALATACVYAPYGHQATRDAWTAVEDRLQALGGGAGGGGSGNPDQMRRTTALGAIGTLKQSGDIILRIRSDQDPGLLREAAFNRFRGRQWDCGDLPFQPMVSPSAPAGASLVSVQREAFNGLVPLSMPAHAAAVVHVPPTTLESGGLGALRLRDSLPIASYSVAGVAGAQRLADPPPTDEDRSLDKLAADDAAALAAVTRELGLPSLAPDAAVSALGLWFGGRFEYALYQGPRPDGASALAHFLTVSRAGHCEFFATAGVLLLRSAGIPARYAVGFSPEAGGDGAWLARGRDAHAWCLAWIDGAWRDVDLTPGTWRGAEAAARPWWEGARDAWSDAWHAFALWKQGGSGWRLLVFGLGMLVLAWIAWRQVRGSRWRRAQSNAATLTILGLDSEFHGLMRRLAQQHGERRPHETPRAWLDRLGLLANPDLAEALALHQRLRFDPQGLDAAARARLQALSAPP
jgi:hypothetical protein